jgi:hypothetical protein
LKFGWTRNGIRRRSGVWLLRRVTYNKHPLYSYTLDNQAGQAKGEGVSAFGAKWYALSAKGTAIIKTSTTTTTTTGATTTNPYP